MRPEGLPPAFTFITRRGLSPEHSHTWYDSLVRVSRRVADDHYASILAEARNPQVGRQAVLRSARYNTPRREPHSRRLYPPAPN